MISLDEPLGRDAYDVYEFQVDAIDCGGLMSTKSAVVSISVHTLCHEGMFLFQNLGWLSAACLSNW